MRLPRVQTMIAASHGTMLNQPGIQAGWYAGTASATEYVENVVLALTTAVGAKDAYTEGHLHRLARYALAIGERLGLGEGELRMLRYGALLHDVGKIGIDERILQKAGPLTIGERYVMQQHTLIGERIIASLEFASAVGPIIRHHHERWDGRGYPDRLAGLDIPIGARIVAISDAFDAMITQRPYNYVLSITEAIRRLQAGAGSWWDPQAVKVFLAWLRFQHDRGETIEMRYAERAVGDTNTVL
jgi:putative two-component system response regulator